MYNNPNQRPRGCHVCGNSQVVPKQTPGPIGTNTTSTVWACGNCGHVVARTQNQVATPPASTPDA